jgi:hypothetical protein
MDISGRQTVLLISYGIPRSGSTLSFEFAKRILDEAGFPQRRLSDAFTIPGRRNNYRREWSMEIGEALLREVREDEYIAIKTHGPPGPELRAALAAEGRFRRVKVHVVLRDPREVALSLRESGEKARRLNKPTHAEIESLDDACRYIRPYIDRCREWGSIPGSLKLHYDDVAFDSIRAIARMADHLGVPAKPESVATFVRSHAFTQFNKGQPKRYLRDMTPAEAESIRLQYSEFIERVCEARDYSWFSHAPAAA